MYQPPLAAVHAAAAGTVGTGTALAYTGLSVVTYLVAAVTLVAFGFALLRLVPRRES